MINMAKLTDLPVEILRLILHEVPHGSYDDIRTVQLARIHPHWAIILYEAFERKYYFMNKDFVKEIWNYLVMSEEVFMALNRHPYPKTLPVEQLGPEGCSIWIDGFRMQRDQLEGREIRSGRPPEVALTREKHRWLRGKCVIPQFLKRIVSQ